LLNEEAGGVSGPSLRFRIDFDAPVPGEIRQSALAAR
jgi:hypothetical protein